MTSDHLLGIALRLLFSTALVSSQKKEPSMEEILHILGNDDIAGALAPDVNDDAYEEEFQENNSAEMIENGLPILPRKAMSDLSALWEKVDGVPTVYFKYGSTPVPHSSIQKAINHIETHTCVRFYESNSTRSSPKIVFQDSSGCSSPVGRTRWLFWFASEQPVNLGSRCSPVSTIVHEIIHTLGLHHEQSRSDRDDYVKVIYDNVKNDKTYNFRKIDTNNFNTEYDFTSILHYGQFAFSSNGGQTITSRNPLLKGLITTPRIGLSFMDKSILNKLYGCVDIWLSSCGVNGSDPCQNQGYMGTACVCICPQGTSGDFCEVKEKEYSDALAELITPENEIIKEPTTIHAWNFTSYYTTFTKLIQAPQGYRVVLTVVGFDTHFKLGKPAKCLYEGVEIATNSEPGAGTVYCGKSLTKDKKFVSEESEMTVFYWKQSLPQVRYTGFTFKVDFE